MTWFQKLLHPCRALSVFLNKKAREHNARQRKAAEGDHEEDYTFH